jgi:hypothetical protein
MPPFGLDHPEQKAKSSEIYGTDRAGSGTFRLRAPLRRGVAASCCYLGRLITAVGETLRAAADIVVFTVSADLPADVR